MTTSPEMSVLLDRLRERGIGDLHQAECALRAVCTVLGQRLTDDEASALDRRLPEELARCVDRADYEGDFDAVEFYQRVWRAEPDERASISREHVDVVLRALGASLDGGTCARLSRALPPDIARMLVEEPGVQPPPHEARTSRAPRLSTLATGRPGSLHPLSTGAPSRVHSHSVAELDPHGETKLSSATGLTQERLGESLATGEPPRPERSIADAGEDS